MIIERENNIPLLIAPRKTLDENLQKLKDIILSRLVWSIFAPDFETMYDYSLGIKETGYSYHDFLVVLAYLHNRKEIELRPRDPMDITPGYTKGMWIAPGGYYDALGN